VRAIGPYEKQLQRIRGPSIRIYRKKRKKEEEEEGAEEEEGERKKAPPIY
jgi:hypothetical protein